MKKLYSLILILTFSLFTGCGNKGSEISSLSATKNPTNISNGDSSTEATTANVDFVENSEDMFSNRDNEDSYDIADAVTITLNGDSATANSSFVNIDGSTVTITEEATYIITGNLDNGSLVVNAPETAKLQIILDNVSISNDTSAAFYVINADKVFVTLAKGSTNSFATTEEFVAIDENNIDATIFSKQDLTFNGLGSLEVSCVSGHGITCKDDLVFTNGVYTITSSSHGMDVNDSVRISEADITIYSGKDGIHAENDDASLGYFYMDNGNLDIEAEGDGISASYYVQIENGDIDILTGGGSENAADHTSDNWGGFGGGHGGQNGPGGPGMRPGGRASDDFSQQPSANDTTVSEDTESSSIKGIKATSAVLISAGNIVIDSADDAIHSNGNITVNGGNISIESGDDGLHADYSLEVTSGIIDIKESYEGLEGLDISISGGDITIVADDDGINAAGGTDSSGMGGFRDQDNFGGGIMSSGNGSIKISGGKIYMNASGDGIDANGYLEISGGYTVVCGPTSGDTAVLDYDSTASITGGTFIGTGSSMMAQTFTTSTQGVIALSVGNVAADTNITVKDADGNTVIDYAPALNYQIVILSTPDIASGNKYDVTIGTLSDTFEAN